MVHNLIHGIYPHPEKFWITLETQNILGGVNFVGTGPNQSLTIKFDDFDRDPYATEDPYLRYEIKLIRYFVDSELPRYLNLVRIHSLVVNRVYDPETFEFPDEPYAVYFPTTNALAIGEKRLIDKKVFETNPIFVILLLKW